MSWQEILKKKKAGKATATHNSKGEKKDQCALNADEAYGLKGSAYKSGYMTRCRQGKVKKGGDNFKAEKESGLHGWFKRRGGSGKAKGWISCQSCEDDKKGTKPCGREDASKGTKRRCRPTCAACKTYKRRKGNKRSRGRGFTR